MTIPAKSTIQALLDRHGLVERRGRAQGTALSVRITLEREVYTAKTAPPLSYLWQIVEKLR